MRASLDRSVDFAKNHERFGDKLSKFQAVSHRLVDMRVRLETASALMERVVREKRNGSPRDELVAIARLAIGEAAFQNGYDEVHLRGAAGICMESGASLLMRNSLALQSASGTQEVQRKLIANSMGLR